VVEDDLRRQAIAAAVGGHTPISFGSPAATIPQVNDGKLRALAVGGKNRVRELPDIPTMREVGFAEAECDASIAVLVPAGVPRNIIALLHERDRPPIPGLPNNSTLGG
jgi:tripartite-type tricarboxylate transporter receptor subunit TctC